MTTAEGNGTEGNGTEGLNPRILQEILDDMKKRRAQEDLLERTAERGRRHGLGDKDIGPEYPAVTTETLLAYLERCQTAQEGETDQNAVLPEILMTTRQEEY